MMSVAVAKSLHSQGVSSDSSVVVDLPNCPMQVFLILGAVYGGYTIIAINNRLTASEKLTRMMEIEHKSRIIVAARIDEWTVGRLEKKASLLLTGGEDIDSPSADYASWGPTSVRDIASNAKGRTPQALGRATSGRDLARRRSEMLQQEAVESLIHFAEHSSRVFDKDSDAVVMFTSGTTGRPKAVSLTWDNIFSAAEISNESLNRRGEGLWQIALPLCHIGGFAIIIRSLLNDSPFILHRHFDAVQVLNTAARKGATHISVVDAMLQDFLNAPNAEMLMRYSCILLGGAKPNPATLERAYVLGARVHVSYGMTETSGQIARSLIDTTYRGGIKLLDGYDAHIVDPNEEGFGRLAVKGPGVFKGYLNVRAVYTADRYFLTGDTAALHNGCIYVKERTDDMFVSGGENIYPEEIRQQLLRIPGVSDAHVFGVADKRWGRRPVALIERDDQQIKAEGDCVPSRASFGEVVKAHAESCLSKMNLPKYFCIMDQFPRSGIGKTDKKELNRLYEQRIEIKKITLHRIKVPFNAPFKTPKGTLHERESVIVEVTDHAGRTGLGECVSFTTDWYLPETLDQDVDVIQNVLAPKVLNSVYLHPSDVSDHFALCAQAVDFPMACGALEPALWDLYGKIVEKPLWQLIGGTLYGTSQPGSSAVSVLAGAVVGLGSVDQTVEEVRRCVLSGYRRVKLKAVPGHTLACVRAIRAAFPSLMITLDANQSFSEHDISELQKLSMYNVSWIEEPFDPKRIGCSAHSANVFYRLNTLQQRVKTPFCLDESIIHPRDLAHSFACSNLKCYALKIGKFGGIQPALNFVEEAQRRGLSVWMGGMYDMGISKRMHAAFETLEGVVAPGDIGSVARYFSYDVTDPPYTAERGSVALNRGAYAFGLGCELNYAVLGRVLCDRIVIE